MSCIQQYWILSTVNRIIIPIIAYCFYIAFGPWMYCEIIDGYYGFVFQHGTYVNGLYLPGSLTFVHGFSQMACSQFPLIWIYSKCVAKRYYHVIGMPAKIHRSTIRRMSKALFYVVFGIEIILTIAFGYSYGFSLLLLSPIRLWSLFMSFVLWRVACNVPDQILG